MTLTKLKWKKVELNAMPCWITGTGVGEYKVIQYGKEWYAYVHKHWQANWGDSCEHEYGESKPYKTRIEAMEAAQRHAKTA